MTQRDKIRQLFMNNPNRPIPCYEFVKYALQYNARIKELRDEGMHIENTGKWIDGQHHTNFTYIPEKSLKTEQTGQMAFV